MSTSYPLILASQRSTHMFLEMKCQAQLYNSNIILETTSCWTNHS